MNYDLSTTLSFLHKIVDNNNREWFNANKKEYQAAYDQMILFADELLGLLKEHDDIETPTGKKSLYRIYRDTRFSKDKTPYKNNLGGGFSRATKYNRGGYYFHIQPGNIFVAGGFFGPNADDLKQIRLHIAQDDAPLREILANDNVKKLFGEMKGDQLKTAPKGFEKDHPAIDLLRYKSFIFKHHIDEKHLLDGSLAHEMNKAFQGFRPFFDYMSEILTTDLNGAPLAGY